MTPLLGTKEMLGFTDWGFGGWGAGVGKGGLGLEGGRGPRLARRRQDTKWAVCWVVDEN